MKVKIPFYNLEGEKVEEVELNLPIEDISEDEFSQLMRVYLTNIHQGTKSTKTRGEVSHPDRKPWPQKHTGRARAGSVNSPIWVGGGVAHGPKPHKVRLHANKKQRIRVLSFMLTQYARGQRIVGIAEPKEPLSTKQAYRWLKTINLHPFKVALVLDLREEDLAKSFRNIEKVRVRRAQLLSPFDLYRNQHLLVTKKALDILNKRLAKYA